MIRQGNTARSASREPLVGQETSWAILIAAVATRVEPVRSSQKQKQSRCRRQSKRFRHRDGSPVVTKADTTRDESPRTSRKGRQPPKRGPYACGKSRNAEEVNGGAHPERHYGAKGTSSPNPTLGAVEERVRRLLARMITYATTGSSSRFSGGPGLVSSIPRSGAPEMMSYLPQSGAPDLMH